MTTTLHDEHGRMVWCSECGRWPATTRVSPECALCAVCTEDAFGGSDEPDYGGAFDGFTVSSDADPGL